jgi:hypothetical protein
MRQGMSAEPNAFLMHLADFTPTHHVALFVSRKPISDIPFCFSDPQKNDRRQPQIIQHRKGLVVHALVSIVKGNDQGLVGKRFAVNQARHDFFKIDCPVSLCMDFAYATTKQFRGYGDVRLEMVYPMKGQYGEDVAQWDPDGFFCQQMWTSDDERCRPEVSGIFS